MQLSGIGVSPGIALGPIHRVVRIQSDDPIRASARVVFQALEAVATDLEQRAESAEIDVARDVLSAQAMIARDPALQEAIGSRLTDDVEYPDIRGAIAEAFAGFQDALLALGGYFAERVADLDEIAERLRAKLSGREIESVSLKSASVIVAEDLTPADTAALDLKFARALVVAKGGPTSHTAIVARGLGIPAVVGCEGVMDLPEGISILVDGREGSILVDPTSGEVQVRESREDALRARASSVVGPGRLADHTPVMLLANAGNAQDAIAAASVGAEGIGLFRTELLFLDRDDEPSIDEQVQMYRSVFEAMAGQRVVLRTLDAGSDKPVPFIHAIHEENPALGVRGWRLTRTADDVLHRQIDAVAIAAREFHNDVWVMAPMIATPAEAAEFAKRVRARGLHHVGVMVETPAAALLADKVLAEVDFASLGTNDLTQYVMAADRLDARLSDLTSTWHPAVLRTIKIAASSANVLGRPIGVCGESAANPQLAAILVGLGVNSLSMAPSALAEVRGFLAQIDSDTCQRVAEQVLTAASAQEAQGIALDLLGA